MERFFWLVEGELAGSSCPGGRGQRRDDSAALHEDLASLRSHGIGAVLTLTETPLDEAPLLSQDIEVLHMPVVDLTPPSPDQLMHALHFIDVQRSAGNATVVHCLMGQGRTGTVLAAYLIRGGMSSDESIEHLRSICPGALGVPEQERALHAFAQRKDWVL